jgi:hypothetical protein
MTVSRKLSGGSEGKGRNGYIHIAEMEGSIDFADGVRLHIDVFSKRRDRHDAPPIILILDKADAEALAGMLTDYLAGKIK